MLRHGPRFPLGAGLAAGHSPLLQPADLRLGDTQHRTAEPHGRTVAGPVLITVAVELILAGPKSFDPN
jgi:hypothetical protein